MRNFLPSIHCGILTKPTRFRQTHAGLHRLFGLISTLQSPVISFEAFHQPQCAINHGLSMMQRLAPLYFLNGQGQNFMQTIQSALITLFGPTIAATQSPRMVQAWREILWLGPRAALKGVIQSMSSMQRPLLTFKQHLILQNDGTSA